MAIPHLCVLFHSNYIRPGEDRWQPYNIECQHQKYGVISLIKEALACYVMFCTFTSLLRNVNLHLAEMWSLSLESVYTDRRPEVQWSKSRAHDYLRRVSNGPLSVYIAYIRVSQIAQGHIHVIITYHYYQAIQNRNWSIFD